MLPFNVEGENPRNAQFPSTSPRINQECDCDVYRLGDEFLNKRIVEKYNYFEHEPRLRNWISMPPGGMVVARLVMPSAFS